MRAHMIRRSIRSVAAAIVAAGLLVPAVALAQNDAPQRPEDDVAIRPRVPEDDAPVPGPIGENPDTLNEGGEGHEAAHGGHGDPTKQYNFFKLHYGKDQYGGKFGDGVQGPAGHEEPEEPMSGPFAFMVINFGILLVLLGKFGGPVARKMAETRSDEIKKALDEAAKLRKAASDKLDEYSAKLGAAQAEMATMLTNMRADAETEKQRIMANAEAQAIAVQKDAEIRIAAEIDRARVELAREVAIAAAGAAEKLLLAKTTSADHTTMVAAFVEDVESAARGRAGVA